VRDGQDEDLLKVMDLSQSRSVEAPPSLQQASRKRMQAAKQSIGLKAEAGHQTIEPLLNCSARFELTRQGLSRLAGGGWLLKSMFIALFRGTDESGHSRRERRY